MRNEEDLKRDDSKKKGQSIYYIHWWIYCIHSYWEECFIILKPYTQNFKNKKCRHTSVWKQLLHCSHHKSFLDENNTNQFVK